MKQKLLNVEELTVKYALNELDLTESRLLEAAMRDDQDVLIEAESQRRTWARVNQLPLISAPAGLLDDTVRMAVSAHRKPKTRMFPLTPAWRWAAAASILVMASLPFLRNTEETTITTVDVGIASPDSQPSAEPWVDNQDVIRIQDASKATAKTDSAAQLVPIDPNKPSTSGVAPRQLQLTGSKRTP